MPPKRLSILGVGLLGGSIGLAAKSALSACEIVGYAHRQQTRDLALQVGAIDRAAESAAEAVDGADLVILCTPVSLFEPLLAEIAPVIAKSAVVTDVGSTKRSVVLAAQRLLGKKSRFVGSHPIAGSEKRGVEFARADLFRNALCILTPTADTDPAALSEIASFWKSLGMRTTQLTPDEHDRILANVSHLPHLLAAVLVAMQDSAAMTLAGKGFLDTTRIASGDGALWRDILLDNRDSILAGIAKLENRLSQVRQWLEDGNGDAIRAFLDTAAQRRDQLLKEKLREINQE
jgi:prephenate dehydrogenase